MLNIADALSQARVERNTLKAAIREQRFLDALALDRLRDQQRDAQERAARIQYELALQQDIEREQSRID